MFCNHAYGLLLTEFCKASLIDLVYILLLKERKCGILCNVCCAHAHCGLPRVLFWNILLYVYILYVRVLYISF